MAILDRLSLLEQINLQLADNSTQEISPRDIRSNLVNIVDSVHLVTADKDLNFANFGTPDLRTTRGGVDALGNLSLAGYNSTDNSAFGFSALKGNYSGTKNTAIGSYSMSCNLYGSGNLAAGYNALAGNVFGSHNVAIGSHAIQTNKHGNFNIAIGHGAGYYIGESENYKLYVASHDVNDTTLCGVTAGVGPDPLIYGDLNTLKLGVKTKVLHDFGALQVGGSTSPVSGQQYDLGYYQGSEDYRWRHAYLSNSINEKIMFNDSSAARVKGDIVPDATNVYKIGDSGRGLLWDGFFNDLTVSGVANITDLRWTTIEDCTYDCRTLYLASSGLCDGTSNPPCGYLSDTQVEGGGLVLQASGSDYKRDYHWTYKAPDYSQSCIATNLVGDVSAMAHANWYSNISVNIDSGRHIRVDRVVANNNDLSLLTNNNCHGIFIRKKGDLLDNITEAASGEAAWFVSKEDLASNTYGNMGDVNVVSSGSSPDYTVAYSSTTSGVSVGQHLISRTSRTKNSDPSQEKIVGFDIRYEDEKDEVDTGTDQPKDRLKISAYDESLTPINAVTIMRGAGSLDTHGTVGIVDYTGDILPETIFNVQSTGVPENRTTGSTGSKLQLLASSNKKKDGLELEYEYSSRSASINMFRNYVEEQVLNVSQDNNKVSVGHPTANEMLTIGSGVQSGTSAAISVLESSGAISSSAGFGKIYVKEHIANNQCQTIFFSDDCGNEFNLVGNKFATSGDRVYTDSNCNTHVGNHSPDNRHLIESRGSTGNTSLGNHSLRDLNGGDKNIAVGCGAGSGVTTGSENILIGNNAGAVETITTGSKNIFVGHDLDAGNCSNTVMLGFGTDPFLSGVMGPDAEDRKLTLRKGSLDVTSSDDFDLITFNTSGINITDTVNQYPDQEITFNFTGPNSSNVLTPNTLLTLNHSVAPMVSDLCDPCNFSSPSTARPYAQLDGDLRVKGAIRFCDGTSLDTVGDLVISAGSGILVKQSLGDNTKVHLGFNTLPTNTSANASDFYLAMASGETHSKINVAGLAALMNPLAARIDACVDGQEGYRYLFTNNSTLGDRGCNTIYMGNEAGHLSNGWNHSVMVGTHAGRNAHIHYSSSSEHASVFVGHQAGEDTVGCHSATFIGPNAGFNADQSYRSTFIGDEAGQNAQSNRSVGIGDNALEGVTGTCNLEITTGIGKDGVAPWETRLMNGTISNKINIGDCFAGDMSQRRLSVGDATLTPDAVLSVKRDNYQGHNDTDWIIDYQQMGTKVGGVQEDGVPFAEYTNFDPADPNKTTSRIYVEGYLQSSITTPSSATSPTSARMKVKDKNWNDEEFEILVVNRDTTLSIHNGAYVIAILINGEYRPIWSSCQ
jgi:hypothetical protein